MMDGMPNYEQLNGAAHIRHSVRPARATLPGCTLTVDP